MRYDVGLPNCYQHKTRGMLTIYENCDTSGVGLDEHFFEMMAKQLTGAMIQILGWDSKALRRRIDLEFYHSKMFVFLDSVYIYVFIQAGAYLTAMWVRCESDRPLRESDLYHLNGQSLRFNIVYDPSLEVKEAFLSRVDPDGKGRDTVFKDFMMRKRHDEWIFELQSLYGMVDRKHTPQLRFETEVICGEWPDCEIIIYTGESLAEKEKPIIEDLLTSFFNSWEQKYPGEYVHDVVFQKSRKGRININVDFGSINPSAIDALLNMINNSDLQAKKIVIK